MPALDPELDPVRTERQTVFLIALVVFLLVNLTWIWGLNLDHDGQVFSGFVDGRVHEDQFSYIAKMRQGREGAWRYESRYTNERQRPVLLFVFYLALGHLCRLTGLELMTVFHLARIAAGVLLFVAVDRLARQWEFRGSSRYFALILVFTAEGVGWAARFVNPAFEPVEILQVEAFVFQTMANFPHLTFSTALLVLALTDLDGWARGRAGPAALARLALWCFLQAWVHPRIMLTLVAVGSSAALLGRWRGEWPLKRWAIGLGVAVAAAVPPMILTLLSIRADPLWREYSDPGAPTSNPLFYLEAYGLLWPLAIWGAWDAWRRREAWGVALVAWLIAACVVPYLPIASQRRLAQGWNIPLALLAARVLADRAWPWLRFRWGERRAGWAAAALCLVLAGSTFGYIGRGLRDIHRRQFPTYYSADRAGAFAWLEANTAVDDVVLSARRIGVMIPAVAGNRVAVGHWAETFDLDVRGAIVGLIFDSATLDFTRREFLDRLGVRYLLYSQWEAALGPYRPMEDPQLWRPVWAGPSLTLFERVDG